MVAPSGYLLWLERRVVLADAAIAAAQEVIGQCDCGMDEPPPNPKKAWHAARDAYYAAKPDEAERCPETGLMDGSGQCILPVGHAGRHRLSAEAV